MIPFIWSIYSSKVENAILVAPHAGVMEKAFGRLARGSVSGQVDLFLDVDLSTGQIKSARFRLFGPTLLLAACEGLCAFIEGKTIAQAGRLTPGLLCRELDFPTSGAGFLEIALGALFDALEECSDITPQVISPINTYVEGELPDFDSLNSDERLALIESVLDQKIRPYIELDDGAIVVKELKGHRLIITYEGACTTCPSAIGGTLQSITEVLRMTVCANLVVEPDMEALSNFT